MSFRREPRVSNDTWILVADRSKAILFKSTWPELARFEEAHHLVHAEGAAHRDEVLTDRPGRFAGPGPVRQSGEPQTDFPHRTAQDFAVRIVELLEQGRTKNEFGRLVVVSPPLMLGVLREHFTPSLSKTIVLELSKCLVGIRAQDIANQVRDALSQTASR